MEKQLASGEGRRAGDGRGGTPVVPRSVPEGGLPEAEPDLPWSSRVVEVQRTDTEIVRAVWWWRGEELVITLQWLVSGADGRWHALTAPPPPPSAGSPR